MTDTDDLENYCETHDVNISALPAAFGDCPYCVEEQRIEDERVHQMTRDPEMEPW